jgi:photosystem II stability/assembly factor-like uncharacterized protein
MRGLIAALMVVIAPAGVNALAGEWARCDHANGRFTCVTVVQRSTEEIYAGTDEGAVAVSVDAGISWNFQRCATGFARRINAVCYDEKSRCVFAAADNGIFRSNDAGKSWKQVFKAGTGKECAAIQATPEGIYAATNAGMFFSYDGNLWRKQQTDFSAVALAYSVPGVLLAALDEGVYGQPLPSGMWRKVLTGRLAVTDGERDTDEPMADDETKKSSITALASDKAGMIVAALAHAIFISRDQGATWERIAPADGLPSAPTAVLSSGRTIIAASATGVRVYADGHWSDCSSGLAGCRVNGLAGTAAAVFAATDHGIFALPASAIAPSAAGCVSPVIRYLADEPDIAEVRQAAVQYADAGPEKIITWRRQARKKAWLPHVTLGLDRETGDLWHWESGSTTKESDDCLRKGKDSVNWSVSLIWELGELIWNTDQTGIDARSRLNAELRAELVDEVTKLYFERVRLKMEADALPLEERRKRQEKLLKLEENGALLDGLTDGEYSSLRRLIEAKKTCK